MAQKNNFGAVSPATMTDQGIFDVVVAHIRSQTRRCMDASNRTCAYRSEDGTEACGIGALIPDHLMSKLIEGRGASQIVQDEAAIGNWFGIATRAQVSGVLYGALSIREHLLDNLQTAHDSSFRFTSRDDTEMRLRDIAAEFDLTYTPPAAA